MSTREPRPTLSLTPGDRLLVVAPHPDDELIGAGLLIQRALQCGAQVRVVVVTHGDAFAYVGPRPAQRISAERRTRGLGVTRRSESLRALARLGLGADSVLFLGYPDRGLASMWMHHWSAASPYRSPFTLKDCSPYPESFTPGAPYAGEALLADLKAIMREFCPTVAVYPHPRDAHGDHWAASAFVSSALSEAAEEGEAFAAQCRRYWYLVHRGTWPAPRGYHPGLPMEPPNSVLTLGERWFEVAATEEMVRAKYEAVLEYRSQLPLLGRFLLGFVRLTEVFAEARLPRARKVSAGAVVLGAKARGPAPKPLFRDPVQDSLTRQVERSGDIVSLDVASDGRTVYIRAEFNGKVGADVEYRFLLFDSPRTRSWTLVCRPPHRVTQWEKGQRRVVRQVVARAFDRRLELAIPGEFLHFPRRLFISVETRSRRIFIDRSGPHRVELPAWEAGERSLILAKASVADLTPCSQLFVEAFDESTRQALGKIPPIRLVHQVLRLLHDAEPGAFIVAVQDGRIVGYVYAPLSLRGVWRTAVLRGHLLRWLAGWVRLRVGLAPLRVLLLDKLYFVRSSVGGELATEARILSLAVDEAVRGTGVGTALVKQALRRFRRQGVARVRLEVRPWNEPALRIYSKLGFHVCGQTRDSRGEWLIMLCDLSGGASPG